MKKLLLLGGISYLIPVIKRAKRMGHYVITCDYKPDNIAHQYSDEFYNVSIIDKEAVLVLAQKLQIDGIMSFAVDPGVVTAAYVAEKMDLPAPGPYKSVEILQNKGLFREFLRKNKFNCPKSMAYSSLETALQEFSAADLPVIVKPVDSAGSKGVTKVKKVDDLKSAIKVALGASPSKNFIIEEFLELKGYQASGEAFCNNGKFEFISLSDQRFDKNSPNPYTPSGNSWPTRFSHKNLTTIKKELQRLIELLQMKTSIYNIEVRETVDNKAYIMEVSPRGGGNHLAEAIRYATGEDLIEYSIKAAFGEPINRLNPPNYKNHWGLLNLYSLNAGIFQELKIADSLKPNVQEIELRVKPGDQVNAFFGANDAIGTAIFHFENKAQLEELLNDPSQYIKVITKAAN